MDPVATGPIILDVITSNNVSFDGILNEIVGLLPILIPFMVTCIGLRKGVFFLRGVLHSA